MFLGLPEKLGSGRSEQWGDNLRFSDECDSRASRIFRSILYYKELGTFMICREKTEVQNIVGFHLFALAIWGALKCSSLRAWGTP